MKCPHCKKEWSERVYSAHVERCEANKPKSKPVAKAEKKPVKKTAKK